MRHYVADTHALIWHLATDPRLSPRARRPFEDADAGHATVYVSAISLVELLMLDERGRIPTGVVPRIFHYLSDQPGGYTLAPVSSSVLVAFQTISRNSIPEMPDRLIAATAIALGAPLLTCDHVIVNSGVVATVW